MKKIIMGLLVSLFFIGCSSDSTELKNVEPSLVIGKTLSTLNLKDQFEKPQTISTQTTKLVFAFSKDAAHICNDFFVTQAPTYLSDNNTQFIADVSSAPSLIRSMFILPGLKDFKHTVILLDDKDSAAPFKAAVDAERIIVVNLDNKKITKITTITSEGELKNLIEAK